MSNCTVVYYCAQQQAETFLKVCYGISKITLLLQGTDYGQGVCFKTSLKTCKDPQWSPHAILALVLVGEFTQGVPSMTMTPRKPNSPRPYDSLSGPDMFIIYQDDQAYPEYLVTFMTS